MSVAVGAEVLPNEQLGVALEAMALPTLAHQAIGTAVDRRWTTA